MSAEDSKIPLVAFKKLGGSTMVAYGAYRVCGSDFGTQGTATPYSGGPIPGMGLSVVNNNVTTCDVLQTYNPMNQNVEAVLEDRLAGTKETLLFKRASKEEFLAAFRKMNFVYDARNNSQYSGREPFCKDLFDMDCAALFASFK